MAAGSGTVVFHPTKRIGLGHWTKRGGLSGRREKMDEGGDKNMKKTTPCSGWACFLRTTRVEERGDVDKGILLVHDGQL